MRDKYLNQVQMMYTEKLARSGKMKGTIVENSGDDEERTKRSNSVEVEIQGENKLLGRQRHDARYGPAYQRKTVLEQSSSSNTEESSSKTVRVVKMTNSSGEFSEEFFSDSKATGDSKRTSLVNKDYLAADNMKEYLKVRKGELVKKETVAAVTEAPLYVDTTYSKAIVDVKKRMKKEGYKYLVPQTQIDDLKFNYRGKAMDQVGKVEKAFIRSTMYNTPKLPDFDVGYDII